MTYATTVIIGAGQAGLAMSYELTALGIDHVILERGVIANSWCKDRWDSLRLLTPNWQTRMPGGAYTGPDVDGFSHKDTFAMRLQSYADMHRLPVQTGIEVQSVIEGPRGYRVLTNAGQFDCRHEAVASGACARPAVPKLADCLPRNLPSFTTFDNKRPSDLPAGGVHEVGGSATGHQLARELQRSGRQVVLSVGEHVRVPRRYRGRDVSWWLDTTGLMDRGYREVDDLARVRRTPSLQLAAGHETLDLNALQAEGVQVVGRLSAIRDRHALFSGALRNHCDLGDLKLGRLLDHFDDWAAKHGSERDLQRAARPVPTHLTDEPRLTQEMTSGEVSSVLWATGYRPDHSFLNLPVFDRRGRLEHDGGIVTATPGVYVMGLPFMRRRKSTFIDGVGADARDLAKDMTMQLSGAVAA